MTAAAVREPDLFIVAVKAYDTAQTLAALAEALLGLEEPRGELSPAARV